MHLESVTDTRRLIRMKDVARKTAISRKSIYRLIAARRFPQPVRLSADIVAFVEVEVDAWIDERKAERATSAA